MGIQHLFLLIIGIILSSVNNTTYGQSERKIVITCPVEIDTANFEYAVFVNPVNGMPGFSYEVVDYFPVTEPGEQVVFIIPEGFKDSTLYVNFSIIDRKNWHSDRYRTFYEVELDDDTIHLQIEPINQKKLAKHWRKEKVKDALDWGVFNSKILTVSYYQGHQPYGDIMFSFTEVGDYHGYPVVMSGPSIGTEFNFEWNDDFILGPKAGFYFSTALFNVGLYGVAYTDFDKTSWYLKPRIGLNPLTPIVNISYEYAIRLSPNHFGTRINVHQLSLNVNIPLFMDVHHRISPYR